MNAELIPSDFHEQKKREALKEELADLETAIAEKKAMLVNLDKEMRIFEGRYLTVVGRRYDELAEIEKQIAEAQGVAFDEETLETELANDEVGCGQNRLHTDKLKKLYREVARKFHPDLTSCEHERRHRHQLMIEANRAYESGAEDHLQQLFETGAKLEEAAGGGVMSAEMILLVRSVADAKQKLIETEADIDEITGSEIYKLKIRVENAEEMGVDLMAELVSQVDRQIRKSLNRLEHLRTMEMA